MSDSLCISFLLPSDSAQILPVSLKNWTPASHSSGVRSISLAKSCRCFIAAPKICFMRGLVFGPQVSMTCGVKLGSYLWEEPVDMLAVVVMVMVVFESIRLG